MPWPSARPTPAPREGVGNLGNFVYVGTSTGQIYVSQNAGGSWTNISTGLDGSAVQQIITDPARGSHDAYAVTADGVYYLANSVTSATNPTPTWVNITGGLKNLAYSIFGQSYDPATDPNTKPYDLATVLNSIAANWNYSIPNNPANLSLGYHPVLYVAANSGVYMSTDNGTTWTLYPDTTFGALAEGGDLPHVNVTDLSLSQGNVATASGMPALAGPYQTLTFSGNLTNGSATVTGVVGIGELAVGDYVAGTGIPSGTTILAINFIDLHHALGSATATRRAEPRTRPIPRPPPDPDLLMAATYGEGEFAINLAPMLFPTTVALAASDNSGTAPTVPRSSRPPRPPSTAKARSPASAAPPGSRSSMRPRVTRPMGRSSAASTRRRTITASRSSPIRPTRPTPSATSPSRSTSGVFTSNGLKTIEIYTTDDAGAVSNKVTLSFTLNVSGITRPTSPHTTDAAYVGIGYQHPGVYE